MMSCYLNMEVRQNGCMRNGSIGVQLWKYEIWNYGSMGESIWNYGMAELKYECNCERAQRAS